MTHVITSSAQSRREVEIPQWQKCSLLPTHFQAKAAGVAIATVINETFSPYVHVIVRNIYLSTLHTHFIIDMYLIQNGLCMKIGGAQWNAHMFMGCSK